MFIQIQDTPNPQTLKFSPGVQVMEEGYTASFKRGEATHASLLAKQLLEFEEVESVFFGQNFISVTKNAQYTWEPLKTLILSAIMDNFVKGVAVVSEGFYNNAQVSDESAIVSQIREIIETKVRPAVANDGGDIEFHSFKDGIVYLAMRGACSGCPSSAITLKAGIESMLQHYVPEVIAVEAVN